MNGTALKAAYATLKSGSVWKKWAPSNPGEVVKIDAYVEGLASGTNPAAPTLSTATGRGLTGMLHAAAGDVSGALAGAAPTYSGAITVVTKDDGQTVKILIDGNVAKTVGPNAMTTIDTTQLANGQHTIQVVTYDAGGHELERTGVAAFQVKN